MARPQLISARAAGRPARAGARDILMSDATLRSCYLLTVAGNPSPPPLDEEAAARFLLWFALRGRHDHQEARIGPDYMGFLNEPADPYPTRLAACVCAERAPRGAPRQRAAEAIAGYDSAAIAKLRLGPLLGARERARLARAPSGAPPILSSPPPLADRASLPGVNVIGAADGLSGLGEDARALTAALLRAGVPTAVFSVDYPDALMARSASGLEPLFTDKPIFPINIVCLPLFEHARLKLRFGANLFAGRYTIGCWPWELTTLPPEWRHGFDLVDEIWALSRFLADVYGGLTEKPVHLMPPHVGVPEVAAYGRAEAGFAADDFVFLCMFDFNSYPARKNPDGAIDAFQRAFPARGGRERLLIKTINGEASREARLSLERRIAGDERIALIDGALTREETCALIADADCYVSLHRAEGFGRIIAEAMLLGTPVIATDWSGSASFLDASTGYPASFALRAVRAEEYVYAAGSRWAEPSIADAAAIMRALRADPRAAAEKRRRAEQRIRSVYGLDAAADRYARALARIGALIVR